MFSSPWPGQRPSSHRGPLQDLCTAVQISCVSHEQTPLSRVVCLLLESVSGLVLRLQLGNSLMPHVPDFLGLNVLIANFAINLNREQNFEKLNLQAYKE